MGIQGAAVSAELGLKRAMSRESSMHHLHRGWTQEVRSSRNIAFLEKEGRGSKQDL